MLNETDLQRFQREIAEINARPDRLKWIGEISDQQGESPVDRTWPSERIIDPEPTTDWDPSGEWHYATVHTIYKKIKNL